MLWGGWELRRLGYAFQTIACGESCGQPRYLLLPLYFAPWLYAPSVLSLKYFNVWRCMVMIIHFCWLCTLAVPGLVCVSQRTWDPSLPGSTRSGIRAISTVGRNLVSMAVSWKIQNLFFITRKVTCSLLILVVYLPLASCSNFSLPNSLFTILQC